MTVCAEEQALKLYDVQNFDVIHFVRLGFAPGECEFVSKVSSFSPVLAIAELNIVQQQGNDGEEEEKKDEGENQGAAVTTTATGVIRLVKVE